VQGDRWSFSPLAPLSRLHVDPLASSAFDPATRNTAARKHERMLAVRIEDRKLQVLLKRCSRDWSPHDDFLGRFRPQALICFKPLAFFAVL
jgi:hypothetical protein